MAAKNADARTTQDLKEWVYEQYIQRGFRESGAFRGYKFLKCHMISQRPNLRPQIIKLFDALRTAGKDEPYAFGNVNEVGVIIREERKDNMLAKAQAKARSKGTSTKSNVSAFGSGSANVTTAFTFSPQISLPTWPSSGESSPLSVQKHSPEELQDHAIEDLLSKKLNHLLMKTEKLSVHTKQEQVVVSSSKEPSSEVSSDNGSSLHAKWQSSGSPKTRQMLTSEACENEGISLPKSEGKPSIVQDISLHEAYGSMLRLLNHDHEDEIPNEQSSTEKASDGIKNAILFDESIVEEADGSLVHQYGLLGSWHGTKVASLLFLNTNNPFSAFICGVQGSGKSHTTSCILENALLQATCLGKLRNPLSALVFSYGQFSGDGAGFSISEAAYLAMPHSQMSGGVRVQNVHVFVAPSNYVRISKLYGRIPNVKISAFKLKPHNLDIDIMLTLMNVDESEDPPLYMAAVTQILREMATAGEPFNYLLFKSRIHAQRFLPAQLNMLQMRLNLLESFLDIRGDCPEPRFEPGAITIMDMSCPFVDANTACILFRIALQRYLQSKASGKMIVLDEAHKYMIKAPGAKALNEKLLEVIRLQRHYGARVIVSTQEPTLLTDLIALCSITVVHRFSSPEWLGALRRHIHIRPGEQDELMERIATLRTGSALVYAPTAALGRDENGQIVNGTGRMIEMKVRNRITMDGGQSILAG